MGRRLKLAEGLFSFRRLDVLSVSVARGAGCHPCGFILKEVPIEPQLPEWIILKDPRRELFVQLGY